MILDRLLALFAFLCFAGFLSIVMVSVPKPMLIGVALACIAMAGVDFWRQLARRR